MDYKIYKTDDNDLNPVSFMNGSMDYNASAPKTGADMNAADANGAYHTYHLIVPTGGDPRHYSPSKLQSGVYEGVEYKANNEGIGQITLNFDGVKDIATVVSDWNTANVGNEVSHNAINATIVPLFGTLVLKDDGVYHLVLDSIGIAAAKTENDTAAITVKYNLMVSDVMSSMFSTFGTNDPNSANAYLQTWNKMIGSPGTYSAQGLTARIATTSFAVGDLLDTNIKITNYATECTAQADAYGVTRMTRIQQFRNEKATILAS